MSNFSESEQNSIHEAIYARIRRNLNKLSLFQDAPDLLTEAILELTKILTNYKAKNGENDTYTKFKSIKNSMIHAFNFINDISNIVEENMRLKAYNTHLTKALNQSQNELLTYQVIEAELLKGTINNKIEVVTHKIDADAR